MHQYPEDFLTAHTNQSGSKVVIDESGANSVCTVITIW